MLSLLTIQFEILPFDKGSTLFQIIKFWNCPKSKHWHTKIQCDSNDGSSLAWSENTEGRGENAGYHYVILFLQSL